MYICISCFGLFLGHIILIAYIYIYLYISVNSGCWETEPRSTGKTYHEIVNTCFRLDMVDYIRSVDCEDSLAGERRRWERKREHGANAFFCAIYNNIVNWAKPIRRELHSRIQREERLYSCRTTTLLLSCSCSIVKRTRWFTTLVDTLFRCWVLTGMGVGGGGRWYDGENCLKTIPVSSYYRIIWD